MNLSKLENDIGYQFINRNLLIQALTHRSQGRKNNERLEYLGDSILGYIIAEALYQQFPQSLEGELTQMRAKLVRKSTLAGLARQLKLNDHLRLGSGELKIGGFNRDSIISDAFEAIIAALYLDSGIKPTKTFIHRIYDPLLSAISPDLLKDNKTQLQESLQKMAKPTPTYTLSSQSGEAHRPVFYITCTIDEQTQFQGIGKSIKVAEQNAAHQALQFMKKNKV